MKFGICWLELGLQRILGVLGLDFVFRAGVEGMVFCGVGGCGGGGLGLRLAGISKYVVERAPHQTPILKA